MIANYVEIIELCEFDKTRLDLRNFSKVARGICEAVTLRYCPMCRAYETRQGMIKNARQALIVQGYSGRFKLI